MYKETICNIASGGGEKVSNQKTVAYIINNH